MMRKKQNKPVAKLFTLLLFCVACFATVGTFGKLHWIFDLFSHFMVQYTLAALVGVVVFLLYKSYVRMLLACALAAVLIYKIMPLWYVQDPEHVSEYEEIKLLQYNVNITNNNISEMYQWIIHNSRELDILVLFEISEKWDEALKIVEWIYPYHMSKQVRGRRRIAIFSKIPLDEMEYDSFLDGRVNTLIIRGSSLIHGMPFVLQAIHPPPPVLPGYAESRNKVLMKVAKNIALEDNNYKIVVGDFNITRFSPWFEDIQKISGLRDSNEGLGYLSTWPSFLPSFMGIAIDNSMISDNITIINKEKGPSMGSDHFPVMTTFRFLAK